MKHYDEYGMPTPEHEELMRKSMQIAEDAVNGGYVSGVEILLSTKTEKSVEMGVRICGKREKDGKWRTFPTDENMEGDLLEWTLDEIEIILGEKFIRPAFGWNVLVTGERSMVPSFTGVMFKTLVRNGNAMVKERKEG